jgi:hypothetical protein
LQADFNALWNKLYGVRQQAGEMKNLKVARYVAFCAFDGNQ